jgi:hypothetical protein
VAPIWMLPPPQPTSTAAKKAAITLRLMSTRDDCTTKRVRRRAGAGAFQHAGAESS